MKKVGIGLAVIIAVGIWANLAARLPAVKETTTATAAKVEPQTRRAQLVTSFRSFASKSRELATAAEGMPEGRGNELAVKARDTATQFDKMATIAVKIDNSVPLPIDSFEKLRIALVRARSMEQSVIAMASIPAFTKSVMREHLETIDAVLGSIDQELDYTKSNPSALPGAITF